MTIRAEASAKRYSALGIAFMISVCLLAADFISQLPIN